MSLDKIPINAFDLLLVIVFATGIARGRKVGMSGELLSLLTWLTILFGCAFAYEPVAQIFSQSTGMFSMLACYLMAYVGAAVLVWLIFLLVKRSLDGKLLGSDAFGSAEYYLGMGSCVIKCLCILLAGLALLNARYYSPAEVKAELKFQNEVYGSDFFPTLHSVQSAVFEKSLTGPLIKDYLGFLLIKPTQPEDRTYHQREVKL
jgi:uncharacterized membrane protein required for colicin V production